jgi:hypothetical protein
VIYNNESQNGEQNLKKLKGLTKEWAKGKIMPPNILSSVVKINNEKRQ